MPYAIEVLGARLCRTCAEQELTKKLGRLPLFVRGKDIRTNKTFAELWAESTRR